MILTINQSVLRCWPCSALIEHRKHFDYARVQRRIRRIKRARWRHNQYNLRSLVVAIDIMQAFFAGEINEKT